MCSDQRDFRKFYRFRQWILFLPNNFLSFLQYFHQLWPLSMEGRYAWYHQFPTVNDLTQLISEFRNDHIMYSTCFLWMHAVFFGTYDPPAPLNHLVEENTLCGGQLQAMFYTDPCKLLQLIQQVFPWYWVNQKVANPDFNRFLNFVEALWYMHLKVSGSISRCVKVSLTRMLSQELLSRLRIVSQSPVKFAYACYKNPLMGSSGSQHNIISVLQGWALAILLFDRGVDGY